MSTQRRFLGEPIQPTFDGQPRPSKKAGCPIAFSWRGETHRIAELLEEWHDYQRRGRMAENMTEAHARAALRRGSRGVGRDFYRVRTETGRVFVLYYDRAPKGLDDKAGAWFLREEELGGKLNETESKPDA